MARRRRSGLVRQTTPRLSVGLHLDLGEWVCIGGNWKPVYTVVPMDDKEAVEREVLHQLDSFRSLWAETLSISTRIKAFTCASRFAPWRSTLASV